MNSKSISLFLVLLCLAIRCAGASEPLMFEEDFSRFDKNDTPLAFPGKDNKSAGMILEEDGMRFLRIKRGESSSVVASGYRMNRVHHFRIVMKARFTEGNKEAKMIWDLRIPDIWSQSPGHYQCVISRYGMLMKWIQKPFYENGKWVKHKPPQPIPPYQFRTPLPENAWVTVELEVMDGQVSVILQSKQKTERFPKIQIPDQEGGISFSATGTLDLAGIAVRKLSGSQKASLGSKTTESSSTEK